MKSLFLRAFGLGLMIAAAAPATAATSEQCDAVLNTETWIGGAFLPPDAADAAWDGLRSCLEQDVGYRVLNDALAMQVFDMLKEQDMGAAGAAMLKHAVTALTEGANVGHPASQYHLASLFNAIPGSFEARFLPQDLTLFAYWTQLAASNREPRALLDLALRLAGEEAAPGFGLDKELAYLLVLEWRRQDQPGIGAFDAARLLVDRLQQGLEQELSEEQRGEVQERLERFDFASLRPATE